MAPNRIRARAARAANTSVRGKYAPPTNDDDSDMQVDSTSTAALPSALKATSSTDLASWRLNKRDKRTVKHNSLLAKVQDSGIRKAPLKKRRPAKKLVTGMDELADALSEVEAANAEEMGEDDWEGISDDGEDEIATVATGPAKRRRRRKPVAAEGSGKMVMTSLKHRPGAMKKKMLLQGREMERFNRNLAQMVGSVNAPIASSAAKNGAAAAAAAPASADNAQTARWAALRNFIGSTMEQNKAFAAR